MSLEVAVGLWSTTNNAIALKRYVKKKFFTTQCDPFFLFFEFLVMKNRVFLTKKCLRPKFTRISEFFFSIFGQKVADHQKQIMSVILTTSTHHQKNCIGYRNQNSRLNSKKLDPWIGSMGGRLILNTSTCKHFYWMTMKNITTKINYFRTSTDFATIFINNKSMVTMHHAHDFTTFWWFLNKIKMISKNMNWQCLLDLDIPPPPQKK